MAPIKLIGLSKALYNAAILWPSRRIYDTATREALVVDWEASDRVCDKCLKAIIPTLLAVAQFAGFGGRPVDFRTIKSIGN